ncbi:hypothetical protein KQH50_03125 [bacterium]|nr:hypothetical protein [bacterium]
MEAQLIVSNSNLINRYNEKFTIGALFYMVYDTYEGVPIFRAHDASQILGWSIPSTLYLEPGCCRSVNKSFYIETEEEGTRVLDLIHSNQIKLIHNYKDQFDELNYLLNNKFEKKPKKIFSDCVSFIEKDLARRVFPAVFESADKDGLVPLKSLTPIGPGIYKKGKLVFFAHPFFRRNLYRVNTLNYAFLKSFQDIDGTDLMIALDPDMVGLASTYKGQRVERAYWWGPKFSEDLSSIKKGVTHH